MPPLLFNRNRCGISGILKKDYGILFFPNSQRLPQQQSRQDGTCPPTPTQVNDNYDDNNKMINSSSTASMATSVTGVISSKSTKSEMLSYLASYETMVRMQEAEYNTTSEFLGGACERVRFLGSRSHGGDHSSSNENDNNNNDDFDIPEGTLTYEEMRQCLLRLGCNWTTSSAIQDNDSVNVNSCHSSPNRIEKTRDVLTMDPQWIMLLAALAEMEERQKLERAVALDDEDYETGLCLPELVQAYQLIISGVQSLQALDRLEISTMAIAAGHDLSERIRERTKGLLSPFGPVRKHSTSYDNNTSTPLNETFSQTPIIPKSIQDGLIAPRLGDDSLRDLMHTKDSKMTMIIEEHHLEMNSIAHTMEELKQRQLNTQSSLIARKRRTTLTLSLITCIIFSSAGYWEYQRRLWENQQILLGREANRLRSARKIAELAQTKEGLRSQLVTLEGASRYQQSRLRTVESDLNSTSTEIASLEENWSIDKAELGQCHISLKEMESNASNLLKRYKEMEEEVGWCSQRLVEHGNEGIITINDRGSHGAGNRAMISTGSTITMDKPVKLEMKYNRSIRNAMMLRQVYSGLGGVVASVVLRALFPAVFRFLPPLGGAVGTTTTAIRQSVGTNLMAAKVAWVDRVHAMTVVLLVVRTAVFFFLP